MNTDFRSIPQPFSSEITIQGNKYLYFGGTAYLGISQNQSFIDLYLEGLKKFGLNNGTSRNNNVQLGIYNQAERFAAYLFNAEDALITSSGYLAAQLTVKALSPFGEVIYAPGTHPALWQEKPPVSGSSFAQWTMDALQRIHTSENKQWVIISNSMNNLFPEVYDFNFLQQIHPSNKIILIVDDSHGIGVNNSGKGAYGYLPKNVESVVVTSMAKALGVDAGLVLGSAKIIGQLKSTNEFLGASPPSAAGLFAFMHAEEIYKTQLQKLQQNINAFTANSKQGFIYEPGFPVFLIDDEHIAGKLLADKILISSFPYPNAASKPINRIVLSSWHNSTQIEQLLKSISG